MLIAWSREEITIESATVNPAVQSQKLIPDWETASYATGDWAGLRSQLEDRGIRFTFEYYSEGWGNLVGGLTPGAVYTGLFLLENNIDFEKLMGWTGASFGTTWLWLSGRDPSVDLVGDAFSVSNIAGFQTFRLYDMWFQQNLGGHFVSLCVGQLAADSEFAISQYGTLFLNSTFGWPAFLSANLPAGGPAYPMGVPGVRLEVNPTEWMTYRGAVFQGSPFPQNINRYGFMYRLNTHIGYFSIHETALYVNQTKEDTGLPGTYKVGGWFHSGPFSDTSDPDKMQDWNYGLYFIMDQLLFREPKSVHKAPENMINRPALLSSAEELSEHEPHLADEGLGAFFRIGWQPLENRNPVDLYVDAGLSYRGLLPTRDNDTLGIGFAYGRLGASTVRSQIIQGVPQVGYQMALEATYQMQVTPWWVIQPDIQYMIRPNGRSDLGNSFVVGIRSVISF